jgi:hypothetical protein
VKVYENGQAVGIKTEYKFHDITSTAYTRAANRAISDLVGGGEVSAEEVSTSHDITQVAEPEYLSDKLQKRLAELAAAKGQAGQDELARLVLAEIGTRFLTVDQATKIGQALKNYETAANHSKPLEQTVVTEAREIPLEPMGSTCPKCDGPMDAAGKTCNSKGCGYKR